ncbi:uncharacterized protein LOC124171916 [Ischnura elegans]|uniref:uncharacterized protein LOC124171916 n=1 Tax=Ischnura elegans TaxID=197161 RepID=UPI001ED882D7|nr:uncharacterized protein LOC124171916 [Ischnura elegans]
MERQSADQHHEAMEIGGQTRVSFQQREILIDFMVENPGLATNKINGPQAAATKQRLWTELAGILNSSATGASKTPERWAKVWQDLRGYTKKKAGKLRTYAKGTGGGPCLKAVMSSQEEKILGILGEEAVDGVTGVPDPLEIPPSRSESPFNPENIKQHPTKIIVEHHTDQPEIEESDHPIHPSTSKSTPYSRQRPESWKRKKSRNSSPRDQYEERVARAAEEQAAAMTLMARSFEETSVLLRETLVEMREFFKRR